MKVLCLLKGEREVISIMVGRNDPCSCGSGKKYKKCCLVIHSENLAKQVKERQFFDQKYKLSQELFSFTAQDYGGPTMFTNMKYRLFDPTMGIIINGVSSLNEFFFRQYENGMRGIDLFVEARSGKFSIEEREMLERWKAMKITCFQTVDYYENGVIIEDIWSNERFQMPYCETMNKLALGTIGIGMIEPFFENWCIHGAMMWVREELKVHILDTVQQLQEEALQTAESSLLPSDILASNYPDFINMCYRVDKELRMRIITSQLVD